MVLPTMNRSARAGAYIEHLTYIRRVQFAQFAYLSESENMCKSLFTHLPQNIWSTEKDTCRNNTYGVIAPP